MKAVVFESFGDPEKVLQVRDVPIPTPGPGQVRVRMRFSPLNPSDLLMVRGEYGKRPQLPATPGFEGMGVIDSTGPGILKWIRGLKPGRRVAVINSATGNWQEQTVVPARQVVPLPDEIPDEQAAAFFVNPVTALVMIRSVLAVPPGQWLLQTAAGSALGRMVIRLGKHYGFRTLNVVRRREQGEELLREGAHAVVCTAEESLPHRVREITEGQGVRYALDAVGGDTGTGVVESLGRGGRLLLYGTLSGQPLRVDPRTLIVGQKIVEGFWLSEWVARQRPLTMLRVFGNVSNLMRAGLLTTQVGATFPLEDISKAAHLAAQPARVGKVLLKINSP